MVFFSPLGIPQLSYPSPPSYFTSLRTGSYSYAAASSCEPREPDGDKAGKTGNADASASLHGPYVPWNSRSIVAVDKESCGQGLHASALRRSYIPMNGALPGIVPACTLPRSGVLTFPPLRRVHGASDGEGVQDS